MKLRYLAPRATPVVAALVASIAWAQSNPSSVGQPAPAAAQTLHLAVGKVRSVEGRSVAIEHQAIPGLGMPAMTMQFQLAPSLGRTLESGQVIAFTLSSSGEGLTIVNALPVSASANGPSPRRAGEPAMPGTSHHGGSGMGGMGSMMDSCGSMMGAHK